MSASGTPLRQPQGTLLEEVGRLGAESFVTGAQANQDLLIAWVKHLLAEKLLPTYILKAGFYDKFDQEIQAYLYRGHPSSKPPADKPYLNLTLMVDTELSTIFFRLQRRAARQKLSPREKAALEKKMLDPSLSGLALPIRRGIYTPSQGLERYLMILANNRLEDEAETALYAKLQAYLPSDIAQKLVGTHRNSSQGFRHYICNHPDVLKAYESFLIEKLKLELCQGLQTRKTDFFPALNQYNVTLNCGYVNLQAPADKTFASYSANYLPATHFIACTGPQLPTDSYSFVSTVLFSESKEHPPVTDLVALGNALSQGKQDFMDYFQLFDGKPQDQRRLIKSTNPSQENYYEVEILSLAASPEYKSIPTQKDPLGLVQARLCLREKSAKGEALRKREINFHLIGIPDNQIFNLEDKGTFAFLKPLLVQLAEKGDKGTVVGHCRAGLGRTGQLFYTLLIYKMASVIFASQQAGSVLQKCRHILETQLRSIRPSSVWLQEHEEYSIHNAALLHAYKPFLKADLRPKLSQTSPSPRFTPTVSVSAANAFPSRLPRASKSEQDLSPLIAAENGRRSRYRAAANALINKIFASPLPLGLETEETINLLVPAAGSFPSFYPLVSVLLSKLPRLRKIHFVLIDPSRFQATLFYSHYRELEIQEALASYGKERQLELSVDYVIGTLKPYLFEENTLKFDLVYIEQPYISAVQQYFNGWQRRDRQLGLNIQLPYLALHLKPNALVLGACKTEEEQRQLEATLRLSFNEGFKLQKRISLAQAEGLTEFSTGSLGHYSPGLFPNKQRAEEKVALLQRSERELTAWINLSLVCGLMAALMKEKHPLPSLLIALLGVIALLNRHEPGQGQKIKILIGVTQILGHCLVTAIETGTETEEPLSFPPLPS